MQLIVISGFLGSGKTTLLLELAKVFSGQGRKNAIIENEVGDIGVDGEFLKEEGLSVREIFAGCVCCSLRHDLIHTLLELEREVQPDIVFLEPSGVAGPKQIMHCLCGYGGEINRTVLLTVADAKRLPVIRDFSMPLIHDGVEIADLVAVNKADLVSNEQMQELRSRLLEINPAAELLPVSAVQGAGMDQLIEKLTDLLAVSAEKAETEHPHDPFPNAAIFAESMEITAPSSDVAEQIENFLKQLCVKLKQEEGLLVGHLKAILKTEPSGYAVFSITDSDQSVSRKGRLPSAPLQKATLTVNAIAYGMEKEPFQKLCKPVFNSVLIPRKDAKDAEDFYPWDGPASVGNKYHGWQSRPTDECLKRD